MSGSDNPAALEANDLVNHNRRSPGLTLLDHVPVPKMHPRSRGNSIRARPIIALQTSARRAIWAVARRFVGWVSGLISLNATSD